MLPHVRYCTGIYALKVVQVIEFSDSKRYGEIDPVDPAPSRLHLS